MRTQLLALFIAGSVSTALASPRSLTPAQAVSRRGQLVTVTGVVSGLGGHPSGVILRVGTAPSMPVLIPSGVRRAMRTDPTALIGKTVQVTGFVSSGRSPLGVRLGSASQLLVRSASDDPVGVERRLARLEQTVERLGPRLVAEAHTGAVIGSTRRPQQIVVVGRAATQNTVLAYKGVPSRVAWSNGRRVLYYGREQYRFDDQGQLLDVRRN
jgi:hypothetical protein